MPDDLLNIFNSNNKDIDNQKLINYLSGNLSPEEKHEFERELVDSDLMNDAVEGLEKFNNKSEATLFAEQLNAKLKRQLQKKNFKKEKRRLKEMPWMYFAIILILIIVIISFFIIGGHLK